MAKLAARCPDARLPARCPDVRLPARCAPLVQLPFMGRCGTRANVPVLRRIVPGQCGITLESNDPYIWNFGIYLPWQAEYPPEFHDPLGGYQRPMSIALWGARGAWATPDVTREQVEAFLESNDNPPPAVMCPETGIEIPGSYRIGTLREWPEPSDTVSGFLCWHRNEADNTTVGIAETRLWRYVEIFEGPQYAQNAGGARDECCCGWSCDMTLRPRVDFILDNTLLLSEARVGPVGRTYREFRATGHLIVRCIVPGVYNDGQAFAAAWRGGLAAQAQVSVEIHAPVAHRWVWDYFMSHYNFGQHTLVWQRIEKMAGGDVTYHCSQVDSIPGTYKFQPPPTEAYYAASGFSPAESDVVGCLNWYPPGAERTNGVWTAPIINADVSINPWYQG